MSTTLMFDSIAMWNLRIGPAEPST